MPAINEQWFRHPYLNINYKQRGNNTGDRPKWRSYMEATGGGFNRGGIAGPFELPAGMELWKLSSNRVGMLQDRLSEWWCARHRYREQTTDLRHSVEEAALNQVPLHVYVRVASCVKIEWNTLDRLQIIRLKSPVKALWGKFAPMNLHESRNPRYWTDLHTSRLRDMERRGYGPNSVLGGMGSYQLFIPGLKGKDVSFVGDADASDENDIKNLLNIY